MQVSGEPGSGNLSRVCGFQELPRCHKVAGIRLRESGCGTGRFLESGSANQVLGQVLCELCELGLGKVPGRVARTRSGIENWMSELGTPVFGVWCFGTGICSTKPRYESAVGDTT